MSNVLTVFRLTLANPSVPEHFQLLSPREGKKETQNLRRAGGAGGMRGAGRRGAGL